MEGKSKGKGRPTLFIDNLNITSSMMHFLKGKTWHALTGLTKMRKKKNCPILLCLVRPDQPRAVYFKLDSDKLE